MADLLRDPARIVGFVFAQSAEMDQRGDHPARHFIGELDRPHPLAFASPLT